MKLEVTKKSVSKKGTVWLQVKVLSEESPEEGDVLEADKIKKDDE